MEKQAAKRLTMRMVISLLLLVVFTAVYSHVYKASYGVDFWKDFAPQILATGIGVISSVLLAVGFWAWQQTAEGRRKRDQLIQNLKFEVEENLKIIEDSNFILDKDWDNKTNIDDYMSLVGKLADLVPLRRAATQNFLKPENLVLISMSDMERHVALLDKHSDLFNEMAVSPEIYKTLPESTPGDLIRNSIQTLRMSVKSRYDRVTQALKRVGEDLEESHSEETADATHGHT